MSVLEVIRIFIKKSGVVRASVRVSQWMTPQSGQVTFVRGLN